MCDILLSGKYSTGEYRAEVTQLSWSRPTLVIRRRGLGDGAKLDAGICRQVGAELTTLALVNPAIIAPERRVTVAVSGGLE